jgi:hypothetical protein
MATTEGLRLLESTPGLEPSAYEMMRTHLAHTLEISITIEPIHWMPA